MGSNFQTWIEVNRIKPKNCRLYNNIVQINWFNVKLNHSIYILKYALQRQCFASVVVTWRLCHFSILLYGFCFVQWHNPCVTHENEINVQLNVCLFKRLHFSLLSSSSSSPSLYFNIVVAIVSFSLNPPFL